MRWICPHDRTELVFGDASWSCARCNRRYRVEDGIPVFAANQAAQASGPVVQALWHSMRQQSFEQAAVGVCGEHDCTRNPAGTNWRSFFSPRPGGTTLELGAGVGDDSLDLARGSDALLSFVPSLTNARILRGRPELDQVIAVVGDLTRLPLPDGSVDTIVMEDTVAGFELGGHNLSGTAAEWKRVLAPGGTVFLGLTNRLHRLPGLGLVRSAVRGKWPAPSLNRMVKGASGLTGQGRLGLRGTIRAMTGQGFLPPAPFAPLPDPDDAQIVLPIDDAQVVRYFLNNLIRKNSAPIRWGIAVANVLVNFGLFRHGVPYYYLIFRTEP